MYSSEDDKYLGAVCSSWSPRKTNTRAYSIQYLWTDLYLSKQTRQRAHLGPYATSPKNKPILSAREATKVPLSIFSYSWGSLGNVSALSKMKAQKELSGNCNKIIKACFHLASMFHSIGIKKKPLSSWVSILHSNDNNWDLQKFLRFWPT